jgi:hypothetical protein
MASAHLSGLRYDSCAYEQDLKQSTDPLSYQLFAGKYYNCNNCQPLTQKTVSGSYSLVDVESELKGLTRINSECTGFKYPNCGTGNCIGTFDPNLPSYTTPWACDRDFTPTNIKKPNHPGFEVVNEDVCQILQTGSQPTHYYYSI